MYSRFNVLGTTNVATGTVKWFNQQKGYGFIQPETGGKDVFVHISAVEKAGFTGLAEGAKVSYEIVANRGKESAENLRLQLGRIRLVHLMRESNQTEDMPAHTVLRGA